MKHDYESVMTKLDNILRRVSREIITEREDKMSNTQEAIKELKELMRWGCFHLEPYYPHVKKAIELLESDEDKSKQFPNQKFYQSVTFLTPLEWQNF